MKLGDIFQEQHVTERECKPPRMRDDGKGYYWYKGESIKLIWDVTGDVLNDETQETIPADEFFVGKTVKVKMFNFLGKKVHEWEIDNPTATIDVVIDEELAEELLTGTYTFSVTIYNNIGLVYELVSRSDNEFEIR